MEFEDLFLHATGQPPYPYQRELARRPSLPTALSAPTGAGKTAAAALAWLYRRRFAAPTVRMETPRRLVFCLPMRTLVKQTQDAIRGWLARLDLLDEGSGLARRDGVKVHVLMGGVDGDDWHLHPERDAVLVGTAPAWMSKPGSCHKKPRGGEFAPIRRLLPQGARLSKL